MSDTKILLTGGRGMVGRNILAHREASNYTILAPNRGELDLLDERAVDAYIARYRPDTVIHAAGVVGGIQANMAEPVRFLVDNARMGLNVITAAYRHEVGQLMNMSSSCMYPRNAANPLSEELILQGQLEPTNEGYALAKILATRLCDYIGREREELVYKTVIPCNLYGRYDKFDSRHSHMIPAVVRKIHEAKCAGSDFVGIRGDGEARREFMYAGDLADFVFHAIPRLNDLPQEINVGLGHDFTINEYYRAIAKVIGYDGRFEHDLSKPVGMRQKLVDTTRLREFGWSPRTALPDGIKRTYEYFLESEYAK
ncbi:GDP-L-fucose synthase [Halothiobacillus sp.]|uniref:GDP-L-fucose synthase family protein n=1 Tax=Halothiobacillus sp. TaxID=1891311 RepID=UPI002AD291A2|nr:GDP-L-fucose synthase [Halothiobacillus sp.]